MSRALLPALAAALFAAAPAAALPPPGTDPNSAIHQWFAEQVIPAGDPNAGMSCCDTSDGHIIDEDDWRIAAGHYEVHIVGAWVAVPDTRVLATRNPTGKPVVWYLVPEDGPHIYCFAPGTTT